MTLQLLGFSPSLALLGLPPLLNGRCAVDKTLTDGSLMAEWVGLVLVLVGLVWLGRLRDRLPAHLALMALGVFLFELFTAPLWNNAHLGRWAYVYNDVSWMLTLGWTVLFLLVLQLVDRCLPQWKEIPRYLLSLAVITLITIPLETALVALGIRSYAPEVHGAAVGGFVNGVPVAILYYMPVFAALVIGFYRYWCFVIDDTVLIPVRRIRWRRGLILATLAVLLFEILVEPMVQNRGFPSWGYFYRDLNVVSIGLWVLVIAVTGLVVNRCFLLKPVAFRMVVALLVTTAIALPIEYGLYWSGLRVYGPSASANFSGYTVPIFHAPIEIAFAIPCYMALVLATIRYWEIVLDNRF